MALFRCTVHGLLPSGRPWSFRQYFTSASPIATVEASWLAHISGAWTVGVSALQAIYPINTTITETSTAEMTVVAFAAGPKLRETAVATDTLSLAGTSTNAALPDNNAVVVSRRTPVPGRGGRGRTRLPAPDKTIVTANLLDGVVAGHISTAINGVRTNMAADGHTAVLVVERPRKDLVPVGTTTVITKEETDRVIRSLRGRSKREVPLYV